MTRTKANFLVATFHALENTYRMYTPDFWGQPSIENHPFEGFSDFLNQKSNKFEK
jgi:small subunit ribosomal protein S2e